MTVFKIMVFISGFISYLAVTILIFHFILGPIWVKRNRLDMLTPLILFWPILIIVEAFLWIKYRFFDLEK